LRWPAGRIVDVQSAIRWCRNRCDGGESLPTVMVVDDSLTVRKITSRLLMREGYQVVLAKDGVDALEQLIEVMPDVILSDIEMPRMDGFDLVRNIRADERLRSLPVIMITSRTADKHRNYALEIGANHYLGKPTTKSSCSIWSPDTPGPDALTWTAGQDDSRCGGNRRLRPPILFLDHRVARQRFCAGLGMIDNRPRIVRPMMTPSAPARCAPSARGMDVFVRHGCQFRYIARMNLPSGSNFSDWVTGLKMRK
jgi:CheY-like chemotaxis protein